MKKGSGTRLRIEVCCPYSSELEENLINVYRVNSWIKLSDEDFGDLAMEMVKAREVKTETPMKKKIIVDEKEAKDKEEAKKEKEREENVVGPSMKEENIYPEGVFFLGGELAKLDTKFWIERIPNPINKALDKYILLTVENSVKICYGKTVNLNHLIGNGVVLVPDEKVEDIIIDLSDKDHIEGVIQKTSTDFFKKLPDNSNILKRLKSMLDKVEENKKYLNSLNKIYEDCNIEIYEKSSEKDISYIYEGYFKTYTTDNWCYHYNLKKYDGTLYLVKHDESPFRFSRTNYVIPVLNNLRVIIGKSKIVKEKFEEILKTPGLSGYMREVDYVDIKRAIAYCK